MQDGVAGRIRHGVVECGRKEDADLGRNRRDRVPLGPVRRVEEGVVAQGCRDPGSRIDSAEERTLRRLDDRVHAVRDWIVLELNVRNVEGEGGI